MADSMPLAEAIQELRANIAAAMKQAANEELKFELGPVELELTMVATTEGNAGGKLSFKVLGVGAEANAGGKITDAVTHRMKLVLKPTANGRDVNVSRTIK